MKKIMFGLLVAATAVSVSAFTNAKSTKAITGSESSRAIMSDFLVQPGVGTFEQRASVNAEENCSGTASLHCVYDVSAAGKANIPNQTSYSASEISTFQSNGWITPNADSRTALYED